MVDCNKAAVPSEIVHLRATIVCPEKFAEAADESRHHAGRPTFIREAVGDRGATSPRVRVPGETSQPEVPEGDVFPANELVTLDPFREKHDEVSLAITGDQEIIRVTAVTVRERIGDGFLREVIEVCRREHVDKDCVASLILAGEEIFGEGDKRTQVGRSSVHGSVDAHR